MSDAGHTGPSSAMGAPTQASAATQRIPLRQTRGVSGLRSQSLIVTTRPTIWPFPGMSRSGCPESFTLGTYLIRRIPAHPQSTTPGSQGRNISEKGYGGAHGVALTLPASKTELQGAGRRIVKSFTNSFDRLARCAVWSSFKSLDRLTTTNVVRRKPRTWQPVLKSHSACGPRKTI